MNEQCEKQEVINVTFSWKCYGLYSPEISSLEVT